MFQLKSMKKKVLIVIILLLQCFQISFSQTKFSVIPPRGAEAGQPFNVVFRLENGSANEPRIGEILGCKMLFGPSRSTSQSYVFSNGTQTSTSTIDFTYTYKADSAGVYTIPSATISVSGKLLKSDPVKFEVYPSNRPHNQQGNNSGGNFAPLKSGSNINKEDVFIRMIPSRTTVYEQEPIECTIKLYTKYRQIQNFRAVSQPNFDGCLIEELPVQPSLDNVEELNGQTYSTAILKKVIIFPQKSGKLTLNSGKYDITVMQYERINSFFGAQLYPVGEEDVHVNPGDLTITVNPLPPCNGEFSGAVGDFNFSSKLSNDRLRTNEAAVLTYTISGTGNIRYIKEPAVEFPDEFEQYSPKSEIEAKVSGGAVMGTMTVEYTFVPQAPGEFTIPGGEFIYFNPTSKSYKSISIPSYKLNVARGAGVTTTLPQDQMKINAGMNDILHIKTGIDDLNKEHSLIIYSWIYWGILFLLFIIFILVVFIKIQNDQRRADIKGTRLAKAGRVAKKRLRQASRVINEEDNGEKFYQEILSALWGYLSDKLSIEKSRLTRQNISTELEQRGIPNSTISQVIDILDRCEMARYTPESMSIENKQTVLQETESIMNNIEKIK